MASLITPNRPDSRRPEPQGHSRGGLRLRVTRLAQRKGPRRPPEPTGPPIGWPVVAVVAGLTSAAIGWVAWVGIAMLGWLAGGTGTFAAAVSLGSDLWLLGNGVSARIGTIPVTLVPWGATAAAAFLVARSAALAARVVRLEQTAGPGSIGVTVVVSYLLPVLGAGVYLGEPWQAPGHWGAVILVLGGAAVWGSSRELGQTLLPGWPAWARAVPRAVLGTQLVLLGAGVAVVVTGLWLHLARLENLNASLHPGVAGGIALLLGQLAFAPNFFVWAASYALGAGFTVGAGSVVAPAASQIGVVPGIPVFAALPETGPGSALLLWWLSAGVLAGVVAAGLVVRARPTARFDETSLVGGLAGLLGGVVFVGLAWAASGDLGTLRLADLGPQLRPLLVMATSTLGLSGMLTGLLLGLVRRRHPASP